ncbi:MAG: biotin/lipoyl-binding protein [Myxococcales bacterium]
MDASLVPVSLPTRGSLVARTSARLAPLLLIAAVAIYLMGRESGIGTASARGFSEAIPLSVASPVGGRLTEIAVVVGQRVKAGDVIARLDGQALALAQKRAQAERELLEAKLLAETSREDDALMRAEVWRLRTVASSRQDEAALSALDKEVDRLNGLLDDQLVKASDVEPRRREREALAARVGLDEKGVQGGKDRKDGKNGLDRHRAVVQLRVAPIREALRVKEAELAQLAFQLSALTLRAPGEGFVSMVNRRAGEVLSPAEVAVVIVAHRPGIFEIYVPERQSRLPSIGDRVSLSRRGILGRTGAGKVIGVSPEITELPPRLRVSPQLPLWGRRVLVDASDSESLREVPPGEEIRVRI